MIDKVKNTNTLMLFITKLYYNASWLKTYFIPEYTLNTL